MSASYFSKEVYNDEFPVPDMASLPSESQHRMPDQLLLHVHVSNRILLLYNQTKFPMMQTPCLPVTDQIICNFWNR